MMAYLASKGLGIIRQTLFNALFGTGPEASAFYAAFRLPDALFNLIAGGALVNAFIPAFLAYEKNHGLSGRSTHSWSYKGGCTFCTFLANPLSAFSFNMERLLHIHPHSRVWLCLVIQLD